MQDYESDSDNSITVDDIEDMESECVCLLQRGEYVTWGIWVARSDVHVGGSSRSYSFPRIMHRRRDLHNDSHTRNGLQLILQPVNGLPQLVVFQLQLLHALLQLLVKRPQLLLRLSVQIEGRLILPFANLRLTLLLIPLLHQVLVVLPGESRLRLLIRVLGVNPNSREYEQHRRRLGDVESLLPFFPQLLSPEVLFALELSLPPQVLFRFLASALLFRLQILRLDEGLGRKNRHVSAKEAVRDFLLHVVE